MLEIDENVSDGKIVCAFGKYMALFFRLDNCGHF